MTVFDLIAVSLLAVSALVGFVRGAVREVVTVLAFVLAAMAAIFGLRIAGPIFRSFVHPDAAGNAVALLVVFLVVYIIIRIAGRGLTKRIHESPLGSVDRAGGLGVGLIRGLVVLGVFHLVFNVITPADRVPAWLRDSWFYPLAGESAELLARLVPGGAAAGQRLAPAIEQAVREGAAAPAGGERAGENSTQGGDSEPAREDMSARQERR